MEETSETPSSALLPMTPQKPHMQNCFAQIFKNRTHMQRSDKASVPNSFATTRYENTKF
jgi:hypothetical protein